MSLFTATTPKEVKRAVIFDGQGINDTDEQGDTPLHCALRRRVSLETVAELVRLGARVNATGWQFHSPLVLAVYHPDERVMEHLLDNGAQVDGVPVYLAPLQAAAFHDFYDRVELLLARGADPNRVGYRGKTPLFAARSAGMIRRLLEAGADPYHRDNDGCSAMDRWRMHGPVDAEDTVRLMRAPPGLAVVGDGRE